MIRSIGVPGSVCLISLTRNDDSSARPVSPSSESARNVAGRRRAARSRRSSPRGACRGRRRTSPQVRYALARQELGFGGHGCPAGARRSHRDFVADQAAVVFDEGGAVAGSTLADDGRADELARSAAELISVAEGSSPGASPLTQLEVAKREGSVFVVRRGKASIAATTGPGPTVRLVFYDLKSTLRNFEGGSQSSPAGGRPHYGGLVAGPGGPDGDRKKMRGRGEEEDRGQEDRAAKKKQPRRKKPRPKKDGADAS